MAGRALLRAKRCSFARSGRVAPLAMLALLGAVGSVRPVRAGEAPAVAPPVVAPPREGAPAASEEPPAGLPFRVEADPDASAGAEGTEIGEAGPPAAQGAGGEDAARGPDVGSSEQQGQAIDEGERAEQAAKAEEKRRKQARIVAFARRRVREIAARARAQVRAQARAKAAEEAKAERDAARPVPPPPVELPALVDHRSALERQLAAGWGWGADKDRQVRVPLPDWQNWQRVRLWGIEHLAAFRYTKQHHTLTAVFAVETRAQKPSSLSCMAEFERRGMPELKRYGVHIEPIDERRSSWDQRPVLVHETEGRVNVLFSRYEFSAAWTAYPAYDHGCLVYATVVLWDGEPELARRLLDRFVQEGVAQVRPLTESLPARQPETLPPVQSPPSQGKLETARHP